VGELHGSRDGGDQFRRAACRLGAAGQLLGEVPAFDELHREEG